MGKRNSRASRRRRQGRRADLTKLASYPDLGAMIERGVNDRTRDFYLETSIQGENVLGGQINNMPPTTGHQAEISPGQTALEKGGYDTLVILAHGKWDDIETLGKRLDLAQLEAQTKDGDSTIEISDQTVGVTPSGARRGLYCRWILKWRGIQFGIVNRSQSSKRSYGVHVHVGSLACMEYGGWDAWLMACQFLADLGFTVEGETLSRADLCVDRVGFSADWAAKKCLRGHCIQRGRKGAFHQEGVSFTGFTRGSGSRILLRVYDKVEELGLSNEDAAKQKILRERRWGCDPGVAGRVEFQLRREAIKDFAVDTFQEFHARRGEIAGWLCRDWFRITSEQVDRNNTQRAATDDQWQAIQADFAEAFGEATPAHRVKRLGPIRVDVEALKRQTVGCLTSWLAMAGDLPRTADDLLWSTCRLLVDLGRDLAAEVRDKRAGIETWLPDQVNVPRPEAVDDSGEIVGRLFSGMGLAAVPEFG